MRLLRRALRINGAMALIAMTSTSSGVDTSWARRSHELCVRRSTCCRFTSTRPCGKRRAAASSSPSPGSSCSCDSSADETAESGEGAGAEDEDEEEAADEDVDADSALAEVEKQNVSD